MGSTIHKTKRVEPHPYLSYIYDLKPTKSPYGASKEQTVSTAHRPWYKHRRRPTSSVARVVEESTQPQTDYTDTVRHQLRNSSRSNLSALAYDVFREELSADTNSRSASVISTRTSSSDPGRQARLAEDESSEFPWYVASSTNQCRFKSGSCLTVAQPGKKSVTLKPTEIGCALRRGQRPKRPYSCPTGTRSLPKHRDSKWREALPPRPSLSRHMSKPTMEVILQREASRCEEDKRKVTYVLPEMEEEGSPPTHIPPAAIY